MIFPPAFGELLAKSLRRSQLSQKECARRLGLSQAYLSLLIHGKRSIPRQGVEAWPAVLGLSAQEASIFLLSADLSRTPPRVLAWMRYLLHEEGPPDDNANGSGGSAGATPTKSRPQRRVRA